MTAVRAFAARFEATFGASPERIWAAPGRITVIGDHTDYQGGLSLASAIPARLVAGIRDRHDGIVRALSLTTGEALTGRVEDLAIGARRARAEGRPLSGLAGFLGAVLDLTERPEGACVLIGGNLPPGSGLSSSAALALALIAALS